MLLGFLLWLPNYAQEHPFLSRFELQELQGAVRVEWTMIGGNTCFGIQIKRSLDGLNFEEVGRIEGLCGNVNEATNYSFVDTTPVSLVNHYYQLELGLNGQSSVQELVFDQVVGTSSIVVYPESSQGIVIYSALPLDLSARFELYDMDGSVLTSGTVPEGNKIQLNKAMRAGSIYVYRILQNGVEVRGKLFMPR